MHICINNINIKMSYEDIILLREELKEVLPVLGQDEGDLAELYPKLWELSRIIETFESKALPLPF